MSKHFLATMNTSALNDIGAISAGPDAALVTRLASMGLISASSGAEHLCRISRFLIKEGESAIAWRDSDRLLSLAVPLTQLPLNEARHAGAYYIALAAKRRGERKAARRLLAEVAEKPLSSYGGRAIQTLAVMEWEEGNLNECERLSKEALMAAADEDFFTRFFALHMASILKTEIGDHDAALDDLRKLSALAKIVARDQSVYWYLYQANVADNLGYTGRFAEAEAACSCALQSRYAIAYPEWIQTRDAIAQRRESTPVLVLLTLPTTPRIGAQIDRKPEPKTRSAFDWLIFGKRTTLISPAITALAIEIRGRTASIPVKWLTITFGIRAPPTFINLSW